MIGLGKRISYAFRAFFSILSEGEVPEDIASEVIKTAPTLPPGTQESATTAMLKEQPAAAGMVESSDRAVQMLALFQRDGRLIDFLFEDVAPYPDAQLGAAVRTVHQNCREMLDRYMKLEPVMNSEEDQPVAVPAGFDPAAIKVIGNTTGEPPWRGLLRHRGWRVVHTGLPSLPEAAGRSIVAPAEIEIP